MPTSAIPLRPQAYRLAPLDTYSMDEAAEVLAAPGFHEVVLCACNASLGLRRFACGHNVCHRCRNLDGPVLSLEGPCPECRFFAADA